MKQFHWNIATPTHLCFCLGLLLCYAGGVEQLQQRTSRRPSLKYLSGLLQKQLTLV